MMPAASRTEAACSSSGGSAIVSSTRDSSVQRAATARRSTDGTDVEAVESAGMVTCSGPEAGSAAGSKDSSPRRGVLHPSASALNGSSEPVPGP